MSLQPLQPLAGRGIPERDGGLPPPYVIAYVPVTLRLTDGNEYRAWPALVGFTSASMTHPLLGFAGCLQFFDAFFRGEREAGSEGRLDRERPNGR